MPPLGVVSELVVGPIANPVGHGLFCRFGKVNLSFYYFNQQNLGAASHDASRTLFWFWILAKVSLVRRDLLDGILQATKEDKNVSLRSN